MAWKFLLAARDVVTQPDTTGHCLSHDSSTGQVVRVDDPNEATYLWLDRKGGWCRKSELPLACHTAFDLYLPVLGNRIDRDRVIAHLGQSIDASIATTSGDSFYVTGEENRKHLHRLRALCDAVIVGAKTVIADDPQLTTRAVPGANPIRIIVDPHARLQGALQVFNDGQARTILIHQSSVNLAGRDMQFGSQIVDQAGRSASQVERWIVPDSDDSLSVRSFVALLRRHGLRRLFVEGGGFTVSRFFEEGILDRLQVAVAPVLVGEGTPALQIKGVAKMMQAHRPPSAIYRMGDDVLWDFDVSAIDGGKDIPQTPERSARLPFERIV